VPTTADPFAAPVSFGHPQFSRMVLLLYTTFGYLLPCYCVDNVIVSSTPTNIIRAQRLPPPDFPRLMILSKIPYSFRLRLKNFLFYLCIFLTRRRLSTILGSADGMRMHLVTTPVIQGLRTR